MPHTIRTLLVCSLALLAACSTTHQARSVKPSGFLGDYSQLKPGKDGEALLAYRNPQVSLKPYTKVIVDPVAVYTGRDADLRSTSREDQMALAAYFTASLREQLSKHFTIVNTPGPDTLRIRVALTDADQSEVLLNTVTTIMPIGLAVSALKRVSFGSGSFVGFAQAECEVLDSQSMVRLGAAVDKRYGTKALRSKFGTWNDAQAAMDAWSEQIAEKLVERGAGH
jgi:hypothetical protein